jgi:hypothetical protein
MAQLPDRPDIDQLRHQARELHRAADGGDPVWSWRQDPEWSDEPVDAQYADRTQLRPVLDAVLAAACGLGPVTAAACARVHPPALTWSAQPCG